MAGRVHREFTREGKGRLQGYVAEEALVEDLVELIRLIYALRD
jgi:hypothetical protein